MQTQITPITQYQVGITFADEAEARAFLVDPEPAQFAVNAQLVAMHEDDDGNGDIRRENDANQKKALKAHAKPAKKVGGAKLKKHKADVTAKGLAYYCTECDHEPFSSAGFLARHERQVHGGVKAPTVKLDSEDE